MDPVSPFADTVKVDPRTTGLETVTDVTLLALAAIVSLISVKPSE